MSVCPSTLSNIYIYKNSWQNATKFYLNHHLGEGKAALGFDPDRIRILVSMATDSSHRVMMGKTASSRFVRILFNLAGNDAMHESVDDFEIFAGFDHGLRS